MLPLPRPSPNNWAEKGKKRSASNWYLRWGTHLICTHTVPQNSPRQHLKCPFQLSHHPSSYTVLAYLLTLKSLVTLNFILTQVPQYKNIEWRVTLSGLSQEFPPPTTTCPGPHTLTMTLSHLLGQDTKCSHWVRAPDTPLSGQSLHLCSNIIIKPSSK